MTTTEKAAAHGLPTHPRLAEALGLPEMTPWKWSNAHTLLAKGQHMPNISASASLHLCRNYVICVNSMISDGI